MTVIVDDDTLVSISHHNRCRVALEPIGDAKGA